MQTNINNEFEEVIFRLFRLMKENFMSSFAVHLSIVQLHVLIYLKKKGSAQMSDIAENFHIEKPTATSLLDKLVKLKFARRKADKKDRRVVHIILTEKGEAILKEAMEHRSKKINLMLSYLSEKDKKTLLMILGKIVANIKEQYEK